MSDIGVEVSQKMRSAIKAKLMELECYVDDELPDYIMVMVANKRSKSQMNDDLQLFLNHKTSAFVDWLHIVLKKLKEVQVTNPEIYKKAFKRKSEDHEPKLKVKKEKKEKKSKSKKHKERTVKIESEVKSLTDDLPVNANKLSELRKIVVMQEDQNTPVLKFKNTLDEDSFDIPLLSEVNSLTAENDLEAIEKRIKTVKSRLGLLIESGSEDEDFINIKAEPEDLFPNEKTGQEKSKENKSNDKKIGTIEYESLTPPYVPYVEDKILNSNSDKSRQKHARITFESKDDSYKKCSVLSRLGKRENNEKKDEMSPKRLRKLSEERRLDEEILGMRQNIIDNMRKKQEMKNRQMKNNQDKEIKNYKQNKNNKEVEKIDSREVGEKSSVSKISVLSRLGVKSKVAIPPKSREAPETEEEKTNITREVPSVVKVTPRVVPPNVKQANRNLLLKAVADAQKSIAQTPTVGSNLKSNALFTKSYIEKLKETSAKENERVQERNKRKLPEETKSKIKTLLNSITKEEKANEPDTQDLRYQLQQNANEISAKKVVMQQFIVTLDGIDKEKFKVQLNEEKHRKPHSPIIFDKDNSTSVTSLKTKVTNEIPDELPIVQPPLAVKNKERCKYWPGCRQGSKCEFVHPSVNCNMFPNCKFGDKCLYIHPTCKFEAACTRRDCPYSHATLPNVTVTSKLSSKQLLSTCKYFPNCTNPNCAFYHPKTCKFGKFCKNQLDCNYSHALPSKASLTWRSDIKT